MKQLRYACDVNYGITLQLEKGQSAGDGVRILTVSNITIDGNLKDVCVRQPREGYEFRMTRGRHRSSAVWNSQIDPIGHTIALGFLDLLKVRCVEANSSVEGAARWFEIHPISVRAAVAFDRALAA